MQLDWLWVERWVQCVFADIVSERSQVGQSDIEQFDVHLHFFVDLGYSFLVFHFAPDISIANFVANLFDTFLFIFEGISHTLYASVDLKQSIFFLFLNNFMHMVKMFHIFSLLVLHSIKVVILVLLE